MAVVIARGACHRDVGRARITQQHRFGGARALDERDPVDAGHRAKAGDGVRHHQLRERQFLNRPLRGLFHAHHVFGHPLLQPEQRREIRAPTPNLLQEAREKRRRQRRPTVYERRQAARHVVRRFRGQQPRHPFVGERAIGDVARRAERHAPDVLQIAHPQHRRNRPELAQRELGHALVFADHQRHGRLVEPAVGVRDQLDDDVIDARISRERPAADELGKLLVVAGRQGRADLRNLLQHDEEIVEQPHAGGTYFGAGGRGLRECVTRRDERFLGRRRGATAAARALGA